jgi:hypothetical protein
MNGYIKAIADKLLIERVGAKAALLVQKVVGEENEDWSFEFGEEIKKYPRPIAVRRR